MNTICINHGLERLRDDTLPSQSLNRTVKQNVVLRIGLI